MAMFPAPHCSRPHAAALDVLAPARRSAGLRVLVRPIPLGRLSRDLSTYLRHPDRVLAEAAAFVMGAPGSPGDL